MFSFYQSGNQLYFQVNGFFGFFFVVYLFLEITSIFIERSSILQRILINFRIRRQIKKIIPDWWEIENIGIILVSGFTYRRYVRVKSKIKNSSGQYSTVGETIQVNWLGKIKNGDTYLILYIEGEDSLMKNEIKKFTRSTNLDKLGI